MEEWIPYCWGWASALLMGFSKTGLPGVSIPAILLMTEAFGHDAKLAMGAMLPVLLVGDVFAVCWYRHHAQWDRLWKLLPCVALGMVPGWILLNSLEEGNRLRPILGVLILVLLAVEIGRRWFDAQHVPRQWWFVLLIGSLAGFSTILAHAAFPVMAIYLISQEMNKHEFIGTAAWFFLILNLAKVPVYWQMGGMITVETLRFDLFVAPVGLVGGLLGVAFLTRIPQRLFNSLALILAGVAAVRLILV
ncbi:MAG: sulfite exporter TauE/SafE family protein [Pirellulales bacterium]|nr:sulfite exporter TauE/SafE family protein [Pirellulales bacterium]